MDTLYAIPLPEDHTVSTAIGGRISEYNLLNYVTKHAPSDARNLDHRCGRMHGRSRYF